MRKNSILLVTLFLLSRSTLWASAIPVTDSNFLNALTLNDWATAADSVNSTVCGASFTFGFTGTQNVALQVDNAHLGAVAASRFPIIAWTVNGGPLQTHQLAAGETSVALAMNVANPIIDFYIQGMSPIEDRYNGNVPVNSVKITGFTIDDGGATFPVVLPRKVWLDIGDSILSGDEALYAAGQGRPADDDWAASDDGRASYGYLLARHYGYQEVRLAYGGYDWGGGLANVPTLATLIDHKTSTTSRLSGGKLNPIPDVALINLGENGTPALSDVTNALARLRSRVNSTTKIIVMIPVSGAALNLLTLAFNSYKNSSGDTNAFLVNLGPIGYATGDGQHPTAQGHQVIYRTALPYFDAILTPTPLRICPMGDSITAGFTDNPNWAVPFQFGYRSALYTLLTNGNVRFQYVGSSPQPWNGISGTITNLPNPDLRALDQDHHEGYSSQGTAFILANIGNWITNDQPDVILLQAGINDIGLGSTGEPTAVEANLSNIVATAVSLSPATRLIVAQITPYSSYTPALAKYNNYIANVLIPSFAGRGYMVSTVNQYTNLCLPGTTNIDSSLFANGINHPNTVAYGRMAQTWFAELQRYYFSITPPTVVVDTQPATANSFVGEQITFRAGFASDQAMNYQWQKIANGATNLIAGATNATLTLTNLQSADSGAYFLTASNGLGIGACAAGSLSVSNPAAAVGNLITAIADQTGRGVGTFIPGWLVATNQSLIAGQAPSSAVGNFSLEIPGRSVNALTTGDNGALTKIVGPSGFTSSTNYVTCGNGGGAGSTVTYTLPASSYGYDLTNITVYGGWADNGRDQQAYTVSYSTASAPSTFITLAVVNHNPNIGGGIQSAIRISLSPAAGALAKNVAAVQFDFTSPAPENGYCGYDQITVFGSASSSQTVTNAAVVSTTQYAAASTAFDGAIANNLVTAGAPSLDNLSASHDPSLPTTFATAGLNDDSAAANANCAYYANTEPVGDLPVTITFNLNTNIATGGSLFGYDVKSIQAITGWSDSNLANQKFQLLLSVNGGVYQDYGTFNATTNTTASNNGNNAILQTLTNQITGTIASGVTGIQFVFTSPGGLQAGSGGTLIRELQAFGIPSLAPAVPTTLDAAILTGGKLIMRIAGMISGRNYEVQSATNLTSPAWLTETNFVTSGTSAFITNLISGSDHKFFRVLGY
ncbi:MAG TPA: GDSL-type esterase/lipase family protein [Verrucomicrobiae bacterium]|jgi:lysophospholipase L1-like esterase|nr:GDSL-type esterase/lipase family protein [Verrucomicrobiae bacterium]